MLNIEYEDAYEQSLLLIFSVHFRRILYLITELAEGLSICNIGSKWKNVYSG